MVDKRPSHFIVNWAEIVDLFAKEYGWTINDILQLTMPQVMLLVGAIEERYKRQNTTMNGNKPSKVDEVRTLAFKMGGKINKNKDGKEEIVI